MSKMTVIQLLNKISNGEEVPKHIHIRDVDSYTWQKDVKAYWSDKDENNLLSDLDLSSTDLKEDIEILEEPKGIPEKIDHLIGYDIRQFDDLKEYVEIATNDLFGETNKIIDILNQVIDYLESKGDK